MAGWHHEEEGQSTVEYLVVLLGVLAIVGALYALVKAGEGGVFARLATESLSHAVGGSNPFQALAEIFLF